LPSAETAVKGPDPTTAVDDTWGFWGRSNTAKKAQSDLKYPPSSPGTKPVSVSAGDDSWGFWGASNKVKKSKSDKNQPALSPGRVPVSAPVDDDYFGFWGASNKLKKSQKDARPPPSSPGLHPTSMPEDDDWSSWGWGTKSKKSQSNSDTIPAIAFAANPPPILPPLPPPPPAEDDIWAAAFANKSKSKPSQSKPDYRRRDYSSRRNTSSKVLNSTARRYEPPTYSSDDSYDSRDRTRSRNDKKTTSEKKSDLPVKRSNIAKTFAFGADVFGLDETAKAFRRNAAKYKLEEDRQKDSVSRSRSKYADLDAGRSRSKRYSYLDEPTTRQQRVYESDPNLIPYGADPYPSTTGRDAGLAAAAAAGLYEAKRSRSKRDGKGDEGVERERRRYYV
jgi:hypothetical protein